MLLLQFLFNTVSQVRVSLSPLVGTLDNVASIRNFLTLSSVEFKAFITCFLFKTIKS